MSIPERWLGLDDDVARQRRAPLWKRAAWRAFKFLLRKHPVSTVSAAGVGAGYVVKQGVVEAGEVIGEKVGALSNQEASDRNGDVRRNFDHSAEPQLEQLRKSLSHEQLQALERLAKTSQDLDQ